MGNCSEICRANNIKTEESYDLNDEGLEGTAQIFDAQIPPLIKNFVSTPIRQTASYTQIVVAEHSPQKQASRAESQASLPRLSMQDHLPELSHGSYLLSPQSQSGHVSSCKQSQNPEFRMGSMQSVFSKHNNNIIIQTIDLPDGSKYTGQTLNGDAHGQGVLVGADGTKYDGKWVHGVQNGKGKLVTTDGSQYIGDFVEGVKHGKGILLMNDGSSYNGEFKQNKIEGLGIFQWTDKRHYTGNWKDNLMHGSGIMIWPDGRSYEGSYFKGKKHGEGTYQWSDGKKYTGTWAYGKQHGKGILIDSKGMERSGEWVNGKLLKWVQDSSNEITQKTSAERPFLLGQRRSHQKS